jgi:hypothetical protein
MNSASGRLLLLNLGNPSRLLSISADGEDGRCRSAGAHLLSPAVERCDTVSRKATQAKVTTSKRIDVLGTQRTVFLAVSNAWSACRPV